MATFPLLLWDLFKNLWFYFLKKKKNFPLKIKQKTCPCIFSILGVASFSLLFPKAPASRGKTKIWSNFCCIILLFAWAQKVCPKIFENLFQTEDINIFVPHGVLFSRNVQLKSSEIWDTFEKNLTWQSVKRKFHNWQAQQSWSSSKLFIMQNYTDNANGNMPLTVQNVWYF